MKKTSKFLSLILAVIMVLSALPLTATASAINTNSVKTVDTLIGNDSLASLVDYLVKNINNKKADVTGTVLRMAFLFVKDDSLQTVIGGRDVTALSDEANAKILIDWLNAKLPEWTSGLTEQSWYGTVQSVARIIGITLNLSDINGVIKTLYDVCDTANSPLLNCGTLNDLNGNALKNVTVASKGNLGVIYALIQWLNDNSSILQTVVKGNLELGIIETAYDPDDGEKGINNVMKNLPATIKEKLYGLLDDETPYAESAYKTYTADQLLGAAFIKFITKTEDVIAPQKASEVAGLSIYSIFEKYINEVYCNFAVEPLNTKFKDMIVNLCNEDAELKAIFNTDFVFGNNTFTDCFSSGSLVGQFNNLLCRIFQIVLTPSANEALGLVTGDNTNLNANLTKICRYVLPLLGTRISGFDFTEFTATKVAGMELDEMAVEVLKIFFPGWFNLTAAQTATVNKANTMPELAALAVYYTIGRWIPDMGNTAYTDLVFSGDEIADHTQDAWVDIIMTMGTDAAIYGLNYNSTNTRFVFTPDMVTAKKAAGWKWADFLDEIVDWALDFVDGVPAVVKAHITHQRGVTDGYGAFYKLDVLLNELVDFSFLNGAGDATFKFDTKNLIMNVILGNIFNFNCESLTAVIEKNNSTTNILGNNYTLISAAITEVDKIVTALFEHNCNGTSNTYTEDNCTTQRSITYCNSNGAYTNVVTTHNDTHNYEETNRTDATCTVKGTIYEACTKCGATRTKEIPLKQHKYNQSAPSITAATCVTAGEEAYYCTVCGYKFVRNTFAPTGNHVDANNDGKCDTCGLSLAPAYNLGDIDGQNGITSADARLALRISVGLDIPTETQKLAADVNKDGSVTSADARLLLRISVGLETIESYINK